MDLYSISTLEDENEQLLFLKKVLANDVFEIDYFIHDTSAVKDIYEQRLGLFNLAQEELYIGHKELVYNMNKYNRKEIRVTEIEDNEASLVVFSNPELSKIVGYIII